MCDRTQVDAIADRGHRRRRTSFTRCAGIHREGGSELSVTSGNPTGLVQRLDAAIGKPRSWRGERAVRFTAHVLGMEILIGVSVTVSRAVRGKGFARERECCSDRRVSLPGRWGR